MPWTELLSHDSAFTSSAHAADLGVIEVVFDEDDLVLGDVNYISML